MANAVLINVPVPKVYKRCITSSTGTARFQQQLYSSASSRGPSLDEDLCALSPRRSASRPRDTLLLGTRRPPPPPPPLPAASAGEKRNTECSSGLACKCTWIPPASKRFKAAIASLLGNVSMMRMSPCCSLICGEQRPRNENYTKCRKLVIAEARCS